MSRTPSTAIFSALFAPHARAAELIDLGLGSRASLAPDEARWLDGHLARCARCRELLREREALRASLAALGQEAAPQGFAGRVLLAARARGRVEAPAEEARTPSWRPFELAAGLAAAGLVVFAMVTFFPRVEDPTSPSEALSGGSALALEETEHFVVRAPGLGAANVRVLATEVVAAHGGTYAEQNGAIVARIPRAALVPVAQDLARRAAFRMTKAQDGELPADVQTLVIRFELE